MRKILPMLALLVVWACNTDEKPIEVVLNDVERGAFLRTIETRNCEFYVGEPNSLFSIDIEEQDKENGALMESVDVFVQFLDHTVEESNHSTQEIHLETLTPADFTTGSFDLPVTTLEYSFDELSDAVGIPISQIVCKDQFIIRLELSLTNGFVFTDENSSACILVRDTQFASPFLYTINVVEPIDQQMFTGMYWYQSILDGPFGPTFGEPFVVEVLNGHSNNVREVYFDNFPSRPPRGYLFTIACDEAIFEKNQNRYNTLNGECLNTGMPIMLGPDTENAPVNPTDDSIFELWFVEGYLGHDGGFGFGTQPSRLRFTKQ